MDLTFSNEIPLHSIAQPLPEAPPAISPRLSGLAPARRHIPKQSTKLNQPTSQPRQQKLLVFHIALAPYRVDFFNTLNQEFNAVFYFSLPNVPDQKFDQQAIRKLSTFTAHFLPKGITFFGRTFIRGIHTIIRREQPDIVLCNEYSPITFIAFIYKLLFGRHIRLYTISDDTIEESRARKGFRSLIRWLVSLNINGIIFPVQESCKWYQDHISRRPKTLLLPIIHRDTIFRRQLLESLPEANRLIREYQLQGLKVLLFVGRLVPVKNLPFLLEAIARLEPGGWRLVVVGDGMLTDELKERVVRLKIENRVLFTGRKDGAALHAWFNIAQTLVLPSTSEKFGAVVNEGLLAGCRVLCSELAGAASLINPSNGNLFSPYNLNQFTDCLRESLATSATTPVSLKTLRNSNMPFTFDQKIQTLITSL